MEVLAVVPNVPLQILRGHPMIPDSVILLALVLSIFFLVTSTGRYITTKADTK